MCELIVNQALVQIVKDLILNVGHFNTIDKRLFEFKVIQ